MFSRTHSFKSYIFSISLLTLMFLFLIGSGENVFAHSAVPIDPIEVNDKTYNVVEQEEDTTTVVSFSEILSVGEKGNEVVQLQLALNNHGYNVNVDGIFGSETDDAVRSFQEEHGLAVDGIVGHETIIALNSETNTATLSLTNEVKSEKQANSNIEGAYSSHHDIVSIAMGFLGSPYQFGGTTPQGFDSSGFINYVFAQVGIDLERTHADMWVNNGKHVDSPSVGDVVFFKNTYKSGVSHSGIYIGNNQMIHAANERKGVEITSLDISYWKERYIGAKSFR